MPEFLEVGQGDHARRLACLVRQGKGPTVVWLGGFRSDMRATKAEALDAWAAEKGRRFVRFDYSGHGESGGAFADCTISRWVEDAMAVIDEHVPDRPILVGSSMGGWIALLVTRTLLKRRRKRTPTGLVLIAPAVDFTERLMWDRFPESIRKAVIETGIYHRPSVYSSDPYPITRALIEDGRRHLLLNDTIATGCPVHILQGMRDEDVPYSHALHVVERLPGEDVSMTLIKDGDHRLSRPEDLERLVRAVEGMGEGRP
jgi:pimeloyl-ACP methyl ester carboxylesterase